MSQELDASLLAQELITTRGGPDEIPLQTDREATMVLGGVRAFVEVWSKVDAWRGMDWH